MATTAGAGGDVHRVLYDAVALCSASCAQRTTTNPTMKGAATPVTVGLDQAPQPHLTRLPIVSASASPTLSDHCTISWPPLTACSHLTRTYAATLGTGVFGARRNPHCSVQSLAQRFKTEVDGLQAIFTHRETIKYNMNTRKLYIFQNRLSTLFPARLSLLISDAVERS